MLENGKPALYRRNGIWQARTRVSVNRYIYQSLRASAEAKATPAGRKLFYQTEVKLAEGLPAYNRTLNADKTGKRTLGMMLANGTITQEMYDAGATFRSLFYVAALDGVTRSALPRR